MSAVKAHLASLTEAEQKVAQYVIAHPEDIIYLTVNELASHCNSSDATVVRFCKSMGYKGFQDFKINIARLVVNPNQIILEDLNVGDTPVTIKRKVFNSRIQVLSDTLGVLNEKEFERAVDALDAARRIELYGVGASAYVAMNMMHQFLKIGIKCSANLDADTQAMSASLLGPEDVAVGISHTGCSKQTIRCLQLAKNVGATTITITNHAKSPILQEADIILFTAAKETLYKSEGFASRIAEIVVLDSLLVALSMRRYEACENAVYITRNATSDGKI